MLSCSTVVLHSTHYQLGLWAWPCHLDRHPSGQTFKGTHLECCNCVQALVYSLVVNFLKWLDHTRYRLIAGLSSDIFHVTVAWQVSIANTPYCVLSPSNSQGKSRAIIKYLFNSEAPDAKIAESVALRVPGLSSTPGYTSTVTYV
jgi:hypothetical protein